MASLFKIRTVRYVDKNGRRVGKDTPGARKIVEKSTNWYGQYKDSSGKWKRTPLYTDKTASQTRLAEIVTSIERGEAGLVNPYRDHLARPVDEHVRDYLAARKTEGVNAKHLSEQTRILRLVLESCEVATLDDLSADRLDAYLFRMHQSARTKETHRAAVHAFGQWLVKVKRMPDNPVSGAAKPEGEVKHPRRAESVENLRRLLEVARERPLIEATTVRKGTRSGERYASVRPEVREDLERLGRERALLYKTAILTGMRQGELRRLQVKHLRLQGDSPAVFIAPAHDRKNKLAIWLPLLPYHADELRSWIEDTRKSDADPVFYVPEKPNKIFRRDLKMAGIPYKDADGNYFDFHSLRHCTATYLNDAGVPPTVVMLYMRHRHIKLSLGTYNDPRVHDARKALQALPDLG